MSGPRILLFIPPLTQLNTPYPATAYLSGFLRARGSDVQQADLGLDLVLRMFCREGLKEVFDAIEAGKFKLSADLQSICTRRKSYEDCIDAVIAFLQNKNYSLAYRIASRSYLPEGKRFTTIDDPDWFFGHIGVQDKARYMCTMFLEDLADLLQASVGPQFGFSKYAERIARTATSFDPLEEALHADDNFLDRMLLQEVQKYFETSSPDLVGFTVPFGGNLYGALKSAQWIRKHYPQTEIALGGGYANTELRDLTDPRVFDYVDYITLDDGEGPLLALVENIGKPSDQRTYLRTFLRRNQEVVYVNNKLGGDFSHKVLPAPTYTGLRLQEYLSVIDMPNPMHRLWNDGRWNKLTVAHGCYWKKCSFCDISLDYIARYEQGPAAALVDKMVALIAETGETGFHFVDEAAPPLALRDLALEILQRGLQVSWWTNIRFEKTFNEDLCQLLAASGCIAVTGGLEVASPRLLEMMEKGITIDQVSRVCKAFRDSGILVHAYLMYGFPTQSEQETIDSLEIVRQLFKEGLLHSAHWHQFAMTAHSPVGKDPAKYKVIRTGPEFKGFANNDLYHEDPEGADHEKFGDGLKKALYNYMHRNGFDFPLNKFFSFPVPRTRVAAGHIAGFIRSPLPDPIDTPGYRLCWYDMKHRILQQKDGKVEVLFTSKKMQQRIELPLVVWNYLEEVSDRLPLFAAQTLPLKEALTSLSQKLNMDEEKIIRQDWWKKMRNGVLRVLR